MTPAVASAETSPTTAPASPSRAHSEKLPAERFSLAEARNVLLALAHREQFLLRLRSTIPNEKRQAEFASDLQAIATARQTVQHLS